MKIIGICGRSGSGKSTVLEIIKKKFKGCIDCDKVSREVTEKGSECLEELAVEFGNEILFSDGSLNRAKLGSIAFGSKEKTEKLNQITHKYILKRVETLIEEFSSNGEKVVFFDAPTLFESGLDKRCNYILAVSASDEKLISRIKSRDNKTETEVIKRLSSQYDEDFLKKNSNYLIENNGTLYELEKKAEEFLEKVENVL